MKIGVTGSTLLFFPFRCVESRDELPISAFTTNPDVSLYLLRRFHLTVVLESFTVLEDVCGTHSSVAIGSGKVKERSGEADEA